MSAAKQFPLEEEYKKKTGIQPSDIKKLREWLKTQPHLPSELITDLDLILTYHCCGRSAEVSKQCVDLHFTLRTLFTSFFKDRVVDDRVEKVLQAVLLTTLPARSPEGYAVFYALFLDKDPKYFVMADTFRAGLMLLDLWQYEEGTWPGFMLVFDLKNMALGHFAKMDVQSVQQYLYYLQEAMLVNLKGIHFINAPPFMDKIMMLLRPFLKKRLLDILHVHQVGARTLDKYYPMENLPKGTPGGTYKSIEELAEETLSKLRSGTEYFAEDNKKRVKESVRLGKPKTISDIFGGIEGSFKKLEID